MTRINGKAIRAVIAANLALRGGFFPLLLTTALWGGLVWIRPGLYAMFSVWYLAAFGVWEGLGFRFCCAAPRTWLVPGLREHYRLVRFIAIPAVSCAVAAGNGNAETFPALVAVLWFCALAGFYVVGLSRHFVAILVAALFLGMGFALISAAAGLGHLLIQHREIFRLDPQWAMLLLLNVALTIWMWRRIGTQRDLTWILPGKGALSPSLKTANRKDPSGSPLDNVSVQNAIRFLSFNPSGYSAIVSWRESLWSIFYWSCFAAFIYRHPRTDGDGLAFQLLLGIPLIEVCRLSVSARMFMLPLRRPEIIRRLATGRFLGQLRFWATLALPFSVGMLVQGTALPAVGLVLGATVAAQLPTFGLMLWAGTMTTASGIRYTIIMAPVLMLAAVCFSFLPDSWTVLRTATVVFPLSLALGPILIWLAYRRWLKTEVGAWATLPAPP